MSSSGGRGDSGLADDLAQDRIGCPFVFLRAENDGVEAML
jgi:hypothetical protein